MFEIVLTIGKYASAVTSFVAFVVLVIKPIREHMFGVGSIQEGQKCLLRSDIMRSYYKHKEEKSIPRYEMESLLLEHKAYKALGGNSFVDIIMQEIKEWEVN